MLSCRSYRKWSWLPDGKHVWHGLDNFNCNGPFTRSRAGTTLLVLLSQHSNAQRRSAQCMWMAPIYGSHLFTFTIRDGGLGARSQPTGYHPGKLLEFYMWLGACWRHLVAVLKLICSTIVTLQRKLNRFVNHSVLVIVLQVQYYCCLVSSMPWNPGHLASRGWSFRDAGQHGTNPGNTVRVAIEAYNLSYRITQAKTSSIIIAYCRPTSIFAFSFTNPLPITLQHENRQ